MFQGLCVCRGRKDFLFGKYYLSSPSFLNSVPPLFVSINYGLLWHCFGFCLCQNHFQYLHLGSFLFVFVWHFINYLILKCFANSTL